MKEVKNALVVGGVGVIIGILAILGVVGIYTAKDMEEAIVDTDGDGWSDSYELSRFHPGIDSFIYNPEVSDLPNIEITIAQEPQISINYEVSNTQTNERSYYNSSTRTDESATNESWTDSSELNIGVTAGWDVSKGGLYGEVSESLTLSNSYTLSLSSLILESNTYSNTYTNSKSYTVTSSEAKIVCPVYIRNTGNMPVTLDNLTLTAYVEDWYGNMRVIGTLEHDGGPFPQLSLPANSNKVLMNFKNDTLYPSDISRLFQNAKRIRVVVASINPSMDGKNFNTLYSDMLLKTARVNILHTDNSMNRNLSVVVYENDTLLDIVDRLGLERVWMDEWQPWRMDLFT